MTEKNNTAVTLDALGYNDGFQQALSALGASQLEPGRIAEAHLEKYTVHTRAGIVQADITGQLRFSLEERADFPTTGDWVALERFGDDYAVIHHRLPRQSELSRRAVSGRSERQVIGANIDVALIMQAADRDFSLNRLDRYLTVVHGAGITPLLLLSKSDLVDADGLSDLRNSVHGRHPNLPVLGINSLSEGGLDDLLPQLESGRTYCVLGSSGTGKSTLVNALLGEDRLETRSLSAWNQRGKHTTTNRALFVLPSGAIMIDTPGMRELGAAEGGAGFEKTFGDIHALAQTCRFNDCQHEDEPGCAVRAAIAAGELDASKLDNYARMERETARFEATAAERRKKARDQGKLYKRIQREKRNQRLSD